MIADHPFDWSADRTAQEWKDVAQSYARLWSDANRALLVDPSFLHWLSQNLNGSSVVRLDDPQWGRRYTQWLDGQNDW